MNPTAIKWILFAVYIVAGFISVFLLAFLDDPILSQSHWVKFLWPLWILFCIAAIISLFLPLRFSYIAPLTIFLVLILVFVLTGNEVDALKNNSPGYIDWDKQAQSMESLAAANGYAKDALHFMCPVRPDSVAFISVEGDAVNSYTVYPPSADKSMEKETIATLGSGKLQMASGQDVSYYDYCTNSDGKSLGDIYSIAN